MDRKTSEILKRTHLFNAIPDSIVEEILSRSGTYEHTYGKNELILNEGDETDSIYILMEGKAMAEKLQEDGNSDLLAVHEPGDIICLEVVFSTFRKMPFTLTALDGARFLKIPLQALSSEEHGTILRENMLRILADSTIRSMYKIEALSKHGLRSRIMTHLIIMRQKRGTEVFDISMTQDQLAQYLCVNRSALSYELNNMRREGLIDFQKSRFRILK